MSLVFIFKVYFALGRWHNPIRGNFPFKGTNAFLMDRNQVNFPHSYFIPNSLVKEQVFLKYDCQYIFA